MISEQLLIQEVPQMRPFRAAKKLGEFPKSVFLTSLFREFARAGNLKLQAQQDFVGR